MTYRHILAAADFEPSGNAAVAAAADLAQKLGAKLTLVHAVWLPPVVSSFDYPTYPGWADAVDANVAKAKKILPTLLPRELANELDPSYVVEFGTSVDVILAVAKQRGADVIIVGSHNRHGVKRWALGSVAENVVRHAPVSVLVARTEPSES